MKISYLLLGLPLLAFTLPANADVTPDRTGSCYIFKENKVAKRGVCLISAEISHGQAFRDLSFEGKTYELYENGNTSPVQNKLNNVRAKSYYREPKFYSIVSSVSEGDSPLICYKNKSLDICYRDLD